MSWDMSISSVGSKLAIIYEGTLNLTGCMDS